MSERPKLWRDVGHDEPLRRSDEWYTIAYSNPYGGRDSHKWVKIPHTWVGLTVRGLKQDGVCPFRRRARCADG